MGVGGYRFGFSESDVDLAVICEPPPRWLCDDTGPSGEVSRSDADDAAYEAWVDALQDRAATIAMCSHSDTDPLLAELESLRHRRNHIEQQMVFLVAYMRENVTPRPYTLGQVAAAAGLSISGTRTFYHPDDVVMLNKHLTAAKHALAGRAGATANGNTRGDQ